MSLYMDRIDVVNTSMSCMWKELWSGAPTATSRKHPQRGKADEFQGVIDCHEKLARSLSSVLAFKRLGHMCLA
jgi:hypothetical protein